MKWHTIGADQSHLDDTSSWTVAPRGQSQRIGHNLTVRT